MRTVLSMGELGTERETFPVIIQSAIAKKTESSILMIHCNFPIIAHKLCSISSKFRHTNNKFVGLLNWH